MPLIIGDKPVDMICQFTRDCEIIPIKFRLEGKDGELQEYKILGYRQADTGLGQKNNSIRAFDCAVMVYGQKKVIRLNYIENEFQWFFRSQP